MRVLDFFGCPSLFAIDYQQDAHGVRILASQRVKDQPEWDEFRKEILQQLKSRQRMPPVDEPDSPPTITSRSRNNPFCPPNTLVSNHTGGQSQSRTSPLTHQCPDVVAWQS